MATGDSNNQTVEMFKHYSNVRFLMVPMFFTTIGALGIAYWTVFKEKPDSDVLNWISISGVLVSVLFSIYEIRLSKAFSIVASKLPEELRALSPEKEIWGWVTIITTAVYLFPGLFWLCILFESFSLIC